MSRSTETEMKAKMDKKKFETSISELKTRTFVTPADMAHYDDGAVTEDYLKAYAHSLEHPESFWADIGKELEWTRPWDKVIDASNPPFTKWWVGGEMSVCHNAVDRHVASGHGGQVALVYDSPLTDTVQRITYSELQNQSLRTTAYYRQCVPTAHKHTANTASSPAKTRAPISDVIRTCILTTVTGTFGLNNDLAKSPPTLRLTSNRAEVRALAGGTLGSASSTLLPMSSSPGAILMASFRARPTPPVSRLAGKLSALGVGRGSRVVIYMPLVPQAVVAMLATNRIGAIHSVVFGEKLSKIYFEKSIRHPNPLIDATSCYSSNLSASLSTRGGLNISFTSLTIRLLLTMLPIRTHNQPMHSVFAGEDEVPDF
ncbi:jg14505 [Pararge aegeria aegeria]|uniref:Acyl-CoA synthetase short-chain family member 3, mitochondrial n=1 Tax=Pararge aegeria aegeria TaxID=348720 RepID=A0A8S4RYE1_9NEOP|nr:jg14505 [Pararge aegeria aegeria]